MSNTFLTHPPDKIYLVSLLSSIKFALSDLPALGGSVVMEVMVVTLLLLTKQARMDRQKPVRGAPRRRRLGR